MNRSKGEELLILLEIIKLRNKFDLNEEEFKNNIEIIYKEQTPREKELFNRYYNTDFNDFQKEEKKESTQFYAFIAGLVVMLFLALLFMLIVVQG